MAEMFLEHAFQVPAFNDLGPAMSNDQNLWMASTGCHEGAHLPEDDLKSDSSDQHRRWRAGSGRYARAQGSP
jgi:hypothetical protein